MTARRLPAWSRRLVPAGAGILLGVLVLAVVGALNNMTGMIERYFIYFPTRSIHADPGDFGLEYEDVHLEARDGVRLHGWFVPGTSEATWLWFHGNGGNISHRLDNLELLHRLLGVNVFLFDYRGYGRSEGVPSEAGIYRDARAALAYLRSRDDVAPDRIVYFGRSLGGAVAVDLAVDEPPYGLILESPFPSIRYMARTNYPFLPVGPFLRSRYDSVAKAPHIRSPLLVFHGDADTIVPLEGGRMVYEAAPEPKEFHVIEGAGHNDTYIVGGTWYFDLLRGFMERLEGG